MCRFEAGENQIVRWVGVQHMWLQRWCSEHFSKACEMLRNGKRKSIGVNQLESRAIGVSSSTPHDPNPFHPLWLAWLSSVHAQLMSCICSTVEWYLCLFHADEASWMGAPVRNSGVAGCEKYLSSGGANANRSRRLDAMWTKEAQRPVNNPYTPIRQELQRRLSPGLQPPYCEKQLCMKMIRTRLLQHNQRARRKQAESFFGSPLWKRITRSFLAQRKQDSIRIRLISPKLLKYWFWQEPKTSTEGREMLRVAKEMRWLDASLWN